MRIWVLAVGAALAAFASAPRHAHAADAASSPTNAPAKKTARLVYTRGNLTACPDEEAMKNAVAARLGYDPFDADAPQIVTAEISQKGTSLRGQVDLRDRSFNVKGSRTLTSDKSDCAELASAMTLAISIAIDPMSITRAAPPEPPPPPADPPPPVDIAAPPENPPPPAPQPSRESPHDRFTSRGNIRMGALYNATPGAAFVTQGAVGVGLKNLSFNLEVASTFGSSTSAPHGEVSASLLVFSLAPCFHLGVTKGCALFGAGAMMGSGKGVTNPTNDSSFYSNAGVRFGVEIPFIQLMSFDASLDALAPLGTTRLLLNGTEAWSTPPVSFALTVGVLIHL